MKALLFVTLFLTACVSAKDADSDSTLAKTSNLSCAIVGSQSPNQALRCLKARAGLEAESMAELQNVDEALAWQTVVLWMSEEEYRIRAKTNFVKQSAVNYGKMGMLSPEPLVPSNEVKIPILVFEKFCASATKNSKSLTEDTLGSFLFLYSLLSTAARKSLELRANEMVVRHERQTLLAIRKEVPLILFRLIPILGATQRLKMELIWIAKHHQDERLRSLASQMVGETTQEN